MQFSRALPRCPKCDFERDAENRSRILTIDVAHNRQTVDQAIEQTEAAIRQASAEKFGKLCLIVGGGKIREQIGQYLNWKLEAGEVRRFSQPPRNQGSFDIDLPD